MNHQDPLNNKTDLVVKDFYRSKTFQTILIIFLVLILLSAMASCIAPLIFGVSFFGIVVVVFDFILSLFTSPSSAWNPDYKLSFSTPTSLYQYLETTPEPTSTIQPTLNIMPLNTDQEWGQYDIALYNLYLELPIDWTVQETNRHSPPDARIYDHDCAEYYLIDPGAEQLISILPMCGAGGGEVGYCQDDANLISDNVIRYPVENMNSYFYATAFFDENNECRTTGKFVVSNIPIEIKYQRTDMYFDAITDFTIADHIVLSILER